MMTVDKAKQTATAWQFGTLKDRWMPWTKATINDGTPHFAIFKSGHWVSCEVTQLPPFTPFAKLALLLPAEVCAYRTRSFPQHMLSAKELAEAIVLDYPEWSPWGQLSNYCYSYTTTANEWQVSIWVWDKQYAEKMQQLLPYCTHIIPELAWYAAVAPPHPALLIVAEQQGFNYLLLGEKGNIQKTTRITSAEQAHRCWHGWGLPAIAQGWTINQPQGYWSPETVTMQTLPITDNTPNAHLMSATRVRDISDWTDPSSYQVIVKPLLIILFSWMLIDALVLNYQAEQIQSQLNLIRSSADNVVALREQVESAQQLNLQSQALQQQQRLPEQLLASLSTQIPSDIYLRSVRLEGDQFDLEGQGKQVARLMVLLEKLNGVEKVMLINDIRRNTDTDEEIFQIRLILKAV